MSSSCICTHISSSPSPLGAGLATTLADTTDAFLGTSGVIIVSMYSHLVLAVAAGRWAHRRAHSWAWIPEKSSC